MKRVNQLKKIHIVHTNDFHSRFEQMARFYSFLETMTREWENHGEPYLLFDIGDHMDRFHLATEGTSGFANREVIEETGYDAITLGNNELLTFSEQELHTNYQGASFSVLSCNVKKLHARENPSWLLSSKIYVVEGLRIGVTAATIPFPIVYEKMGWDVQDFLISLQKEVENLNQKTDLIVLLSHLGFPNDQFIAEKIPEINVILGGHTHHLLEEAVWVENCLIAAAGKHGQSAGIVTIEWNGQEVEEIYGYAIPLNDSPPSPKIRSILEENISLASQKLSEPIVFLQKNLPIDWSQESPFANFLADSLRDFLELDIALVNSGQILQSLSIGSVDAKEIHQICPHPINAVWMRIKGEDIRLSLEESLLPEFQRKEIKGFGFRGVYLGNLAVSGIKIFWNPENPEMKKIASIQINGEAMDENKWYDVATIDMFTFGLGYPRLQNGQVVDYYLPDFLRHLLIRHFQKENSLSISYEPRWISTSS